MEEKISENQKQLAVRIAASADPMQKETLRLWIERLLDIKASDLSTAKKVKQAISATVASKVIVSTAKLIVRESKRRVWDNRGTASRLGLGGAAMGLTLFSGQGAGIAALGTAIGVPVWVVFGAGAAFLSVLYLFNH